MTTMTAETLTETLQYLIDARLDTIDRMLLGRVPRADRLAIVREVESQIQELLSGHHAESLTREDVLDVLGRLDPPEAYLPEREWEETSPRRTFASTAARPSAVSRPRPSGGGKIGGILGLVSIVGVALLPVTFLLGSLTNSEEFFILLLVTHCIFGMGASIASLVFSIRGRADGSWPIFGMVASAISLPIFLLGLFYMVMVLMN